VLLHPERIIYGFYPELKSVAYERSHEPRENAVNVLLLGGSVLNVEWSSVDALIAERLAWETRRPIRTYNLAALAHTTRDSLLKYERLGGKRFDLVVVYHGINETRTNNAPPDVFRDDYGHYSWYRFVNAIDRDRWLPAVVLPYFVKHASIELRDRFGLADIVPTAEPRPEWLDHGLDVKSEKPFRDNLSAILDLAESRGEPVLLMTFALNIAEGYSKDAFEGLELDYTRHRSALRWWGTLEAVLAGVDTHNAVIRELAAERRTLFVDQAALIPSERRVYDDLCHLTVAGSELFVDNMMDSLRGVVGISPAGPAVDGRFRRESGSAVP
jgi:hypothetical protein